MTLRSLMTASLLVSASLFAGTDVLDESVLYGTRADCEKAEKEMAVRIARHTPLDLAGLCLKDDVDKSKFLLFWRGKDDRRFSTTKTVAGHVRVSVYTYTERRVEERDGKFRIRAVEKRGSRNHDVPYDTEEACLKSATGAMAREPEAVLPSTLRCGEGVEEMTLPLAADCPKRGKEGWNLRTVSLNYCTK